MFHEMGCPVTLPAHKAAQHAEKERNTLNTTSKYTTSSVEYSVDEHLSKAVEGSAGFFTAALHAYTTIKGPRTLAGNGSHQIGWHSLCLHDSDPSAMTPHVHWGSSAEDTAGARALAGTCWHLLAPDVPPLLLLLKPKPLGPKMDGAGNATGVCTQANIKSDIYSVYTY